VDENIRPVDADVFSDLVRRAEVITVALEGNCVIEEAFPPLRGEKRLNSEFLLGELELRVRAAMKPPLSGV
jgi:hypothetical protein